MKEENVVNTGVQATGQAHGKAFGRPYFNCNDKTFDACLQGRRKGKHWKKFVGNEELSGNIKAYLKANPKQKSVMLKKETSDHYIMANRVMF